MNWTILMPYTMSHICIVLPHIRNLIKTPEDWLITFLRINYSVSVSQIPARWWRGTGGPAGGQFREASLVSHTVVAHSRTLWSHTVAHCGGTAVAHSGEHWWHTVVGARLGPNVPSAFSPTSVFLFSASFSICQLQASLVSGVPNFCIKLVSGVWCTKHCTCAAKLLRLLKSLRVPGFADFLASHCCFNVSKDPLEHSRHQNANWMFVRSGSKFQPGETHKCRDIWFNFQISSALHQ